MPRSRRAAVRRSNCARVPNSNVTRLPAADRSDRTDRTAASSLAVASATPGLSVTISSLRSASGRYPSPACTDFFARGGIGGLRAVVGFASLGCRTLLPTLATIDLCQDKYAFAEFLDAHGVPVPETVAVKTLDDVDTAFAALSRHRRLWCRRRRGQGGLGALLVSRPEQARAWVQYWTEMRGVDASEFTLAEYLPGRDFAGQALFADGEPIVTHAYERLSYLGGAAAPAGVGLSALGRRVVDRRVSDL